MGPISLTTSIDASRDRVFDFICDLSIRPSWTDHFAGDYRLERLEPRGVGAAARFRVAAPGGIEYRETVIAEAERPHLIAEHGRGGGMDRTQVRATWELTEGPGGVTDVQLTFLTKPGTLPARIAEIPLAGRWWRRNWSRALRRMRELIESGEEPQDRIVVAGADRLPAGTSG
jgi:uncharacterized protein YndB with AHSA1/START domain